MKTGLQRIKAERQRQIETEGLTPTHDDQYEDSELYRAADSYEVFGMLQIDGRNPDPANIPATWPWDKQWWKPSTDPARNYEKAGALLLAHADWHRRHGDPGAGDDFDQLAAELGDRIDQLPPPLSTTAVRYTITGEALAADGKTRISSERFILGGDGTVEWRSQVLPLMDTILVDIDREICAKAKTDQSPPASKVHWIHIQGRNMGKTAASALCASATPNPPAAE